MGTNRGRGVKPSQALPLPRPTSGWRPPTPPQGGSDNPASPDSAGTSGRRRRRAGSIGVGAVAVLIVVAVGATSTLSSGQAAPQATTPVTGLVTDIATEDAIISLAQLYTAELALPASLGATARPFDLPGLVAKAAALQQAVDRVGVTLSDLRAQDIAPGTPGGDYAANTTHDALLSYAQDLATHTTDLALLDSFHQTLFAGAGTITTDRALSGLQDVVARTGDRPLGAWAASLIGVLNGTTPAVPDDGIRQAAGQEWTAAADRLAPAGLADLTEFLNGIDPGVIAALDGHPVAGPVLRRLRG